MLAAMRQSRIAAVAAWLLLATALVCLAPSAEASSSRPRPLKRFAHITDVRFERVTRDGDQGDSSTSPVTLKRGSHDALSSGTERTSSALRRRRHAQQPQFTNSVRLTFRAFEQLFHLHLQPNQDIVPPDGATVRFIAQDPATGNDVIQHTETVLPQDVRAYHGFVVHSDYTSQRLAEDRLGIRRDLDRPTESDVGVMGSAAIVMHEEEVESAQPPRFEGSFWWAGNEHTIQLPLNYHTSRSQHDPPVNKRALSEGSLVIHRNSDRMDEAEASTIGIRASAAESSGCVADEYDFNKEMLRNVASPFSFFAAPMGSKIGRRSRAFPNLLEGASDLFTRASAYSGLGQSMNSPSAGLQAPAYSYEAALAKRQDDALGGNNNDSFVAHIGSTQGCPNAPRVVYIGVATDCTYTARFANDSDTRVTVLNLVNTVSNIYRTSFKVSLGVVQIDVRSATDCPSTSVGDSRWNRACGDDYPLDQRLSDFSSWRAANNANGTGLWHLLTACSQGSEVGVAWLGTLCKTDASQSGSTVVSGAGVSAVTQREAQVMAHEIGHNFGAIHDCVSGCSISGQTAQQSGGGAVCCPRTSSSCDTSGDFIMSPVSESETQTFSPCSIGNICSMLGQGLDTSCVNDPTQNSRETLSIQQCGNGILEPGEECDAGPDGSNCCTTSCRLRSNAVCDPASTGCCTDSCQFASASTVCRPSVDDRCDTAEMCTGNSAQCPDDARKDDGASCGSGLTCASGHCTSRDLQCQQQSQANYDFSRACSPNADQSCSVSCQNPQNGASCLILQQQFIDGTSCGYGGHCQGGECKTGSWQDKFQGWYRNNLQISIPVTIVIGVVILAIVYGLVRCLCLPLFARHTGRHVRGAAGPVAKPPRQDRNRFGGGGGRNSSGGRGMGQYANASPLPPPQRSLQHSHDPIGRDSADPSPTPLLRSHEPYRGENTGSRASRGGSAWVDPYSYNGARNGGTNL